MKKIYILLVTVVLFACSSYAQSPLDSITDAKTKEKATALITTLNEQKASLEKMESDLTELKSTADKKASNAKLSAEANKQAAANLTEDAADKKKAKRAKRAAHEAADDAKDLRIATTNVKDKAKDIESLKSKIASNEKKLAKIMKSGNAYKH